MPDDRETPTCKTCGEAIRYVANPAYPHWSHVSKKMAFKSEREGAHRPVKG